MALTAHDIEQINTVITRAVSGLATKAELDKFATKEDLAGLATKTELVKLESRLMNKMTTMATKDDLDRMEGRLVTALGCEAP